MTTATTAPGGTGARPEAKIVPHDGSSVSPPAGAPQTHRHKWHGQRCTHHEAPLHPWSGLCPLCVLEAEDFVPTPGYNPVRVR